jgi:hypothetical protein
MVVVKPDVVTKVDLRVTTTPIENKVVAQDVNELVRAASETIDFLEDQVYGGLYICEGTGSQTISSGSKIIINQWNQIQPQKGMNLTNGDFSIPIPLGKPGIYEVRFHISYETDAKNGEIFKIRTVDNGDIIPGVCTRVQHQHLATTTYEASTSRLVEYTLPKTISLEFEALTLNNSRQINVKHASLTVRRIDVLDAGDLPGPGPIPL